MRIGGLDTDRDVLLIAEIGNNHEGDFGRAREMVAAAAEAGAQAVKFQTIRPERLVDRTQTARREQLARFAFDFGRFEALAEAAAQAGVMFLSTPFDLEAAEFLAPLVPAFKIASGDNDFFPLLEKTASFGKPVILSTGLSDLGAVRRSLEVLDAAFAKSGHASQAAVLHCVCSYPTPPEQANLAAIPCLAREFGRVTGYSDHTLGIEAAALSVALGARIVEKHFTLDKTRTTFRDHALSADPTDLALLRRRMDEALALLGEPGKCVLACEEGNLAAVRRSLAARRDLPAGRPLGPEDLDWLRPGTGLRPGQESLVLGRRPRAGVPAGTLLTPDLFEAD